MIWLEWFCFASMVAVGAVAGPFPLQGKRQRRGLHDALGFSNSDPTAYLLSALIGAMFLASRLSPEVSP